MTVIGFTRPTKKLKASVDEAAAMGFEVMAAPSLDIEHGDREQFDRLREAAVPGTPVVFGSATAAEECGKEFGDGFPGMFEACRVIAIGPATEKALTAKGVRVDDIPADFSSFGLLDLLREEASGRRIVVVRSDSGTEILSEGLKDAGAELVDIASYKLSPVGMTSALLHMLTAIKRGRIDVMAFTSPLSAKTFFGQIRDYHGEEDADRMMAEVKVAAIGKPTALMLESLGRKPDIVPENTTFHDMLEAVKRSV